MFDLVQLAIVARAGKYMVKEHSYMVKIMVTATSKPFHVTIMKETDFLDFKAVADSLLNITNIHITQAKWIKITKDRLDIVQVKRILNDLEAWSDIWLSVPIFKAMLKYAWYASKLINEREVFVNVKDICFAAEVRKNVCDCGQPSFMCCAWSRKFELGTMYNVFGNSNVRLLLPSTSFLRFLLNQSASDGKLNPRKLMPRRSLNLQFCAPTLRTWLIDVAIIEKRRSLNSSETIQTAPQPQTVHYNKKNMMEVITQFVKNNLKRELGIILTEDWAWKNLCKNGSKKSHRAIAK
ncbi:hypothetical protein ANN_01139 [Periplaneta americana]|uniref:Uncharacterized protein n=1 Tax=Periplaneta americana TaxID=6978 RepID=A0ABQ8TVS9_PERAM|nr:hypothetical protein ANN_01139 [Periplaneta americana]